MPAVSNYGERVLCTRCSRVRLIDRVRSGNAVRLIEFTPTSPTLVRTPAISTPRGFPPPHELSSPLDRASRRLTATAVLRSLVTIAGRRGAFTYIPMRVSCKDILSEKLYRFIFYLGTFLLLKFQ